MRFVAERRYAYMGIPYFHIDVFRRMFAVFREECEKCGYTADPEQMGWGIPVYVAETDEQARREFEPHVWYFARKLMKGISLAPPGYTSVKSTMAILKNEGKFLASQETWKQIEDGVFAIVGSPATVRDKLSYWQKELGAGNVLLGCQVGGLSHEQTRRSLRLFADEVMPAVRAAAGQPAAPVA
jgi:alkanesulfonate monooxygenase SsuD/methylene tetrahydromethanopterin reductase-like flavin-dependent oxidoreductase (luciferase family)